jgi:hypothetical protein
MKTTYLYEIDQDCWNSSPLRNDFQLPPAANTGQILRYPAGILRLDLLEDIQQRGLEVREVQMFISPALYQMKTHIDGYSLHDRAAVNWVLVSRSWRMNWYDYSGPLPDRKTTATGTDYLPLDNDQCLLVHSAQWANAAIVRTGLAHNIINSDILPRYCVSVRFQDNNYDFIKSKFI